MKKTLVACLAVAALFAIAGSANAITCTIDNRPGATLLIPYFQATFNPDGTILDTGPDSLDTIVTIGNASGAPMIAHVDVWSERSEIVLDFDIALTGFDIQSFSVASILRGFLPQTPVDSSHNPPPNDRTGGADDICQRSAGDVYPLPNGFLRISPASADTATPNDNVLATTNYPPGPFATSFEFNLIDSLDVTGDSLACTGSVDQVITNPIHGYLTIDHVNYCNLSNPSDPNYFNKDAIGMENNLWGEYIYTNGVGVGTMGFPAVAIEADPSLTDAGLTLPPESVRTFYRRYYSTDTACFGGNCAQFIANGDTFDEGAGDLREPLGLKYAARWFDTTAVTSFFNVWRASSGSLTDLLGNSCTDVEPLVALFFYDEDENTVTAGKCPSPCKQPQFNFPLETQREQITTFSHPTWPAGWVSMEFFNGSGPNGGQLDQAYVTYDFEGAGAFLSAGAEAAQLDPSTCNPLGTGSPGPVPGGVNVIAPVIPLLVGVGP